MPSKIYNYGKQYVDKDDIDSVVKALKSDFLTQGPIVPKFESKINAYTKSKYAVSVNSATSGLHIACLSMGLSKGDILWTSAISFVASANCALYCNASVDFVDIDNDSFNICPKALKNKLSIAKLESKLPKILVVVHMCGAPANLKLIKSLCDQFGVRVIEDASHALGAEYDNSRIGSCNYSDISVFSFHPVKMITTAEGGMICTNSKIYYDKLIKYRSHGITRCEHEMNYKHGPWYYEQQLLGFNYRMNEIQAALGISQLKKLPKFLEKRNEIAQTYQTQLDSELFTFQKIEENSISSYHLFVCQFKEKIDSNSMRSFFHECKSNNIILNIHYIPIHYQPFYKNLKHYKDLKNSEDYYLKSFSLPIYYSLKMNEIKFITSNINKIASNYI